MQGVNQSVSTRNLLEVDRKLKYLDLRDSILKKTFKRKSSEMGIAYVLPTLDKQKALKALEWDKVFYNARRDDPNNFNKSKTFTMLN